MTVETRTKVAEQVRGFALVGFVGAAVCWIGFARQLHLELGQRFLDDEFGVALVLWLLGAVMSTVLLTSCFTVAMVDRYFLAAGAPATPAPAVGLDLTAQDGV